MNTGLNIKRQRLACDGVTRWYSLMNRPTKYHNHYLPKSRTGNTGQIVPKHRSQLEARPDEGNQRDLDILRGYATPQRTSLLDTNRILAAINHAGELLSGLPEAGPLLLPDTVRRMIGFAAWLHALHPGGREYFSCKIICKVWYREEFERSGITLAAAVDVCCDSILERKRIFNIDYVPDGDTVRQWLRESGVP